MLSMTSPWWFFHSVNEKKKKKETGKYVLFLSFVHFAVIRALTLPFHHLIALPSSEMAFQNLFPRWHPPTQCPHKTPGLQCQKSREECSSSLKCQSGLAIKPLLTGFPPPLTPCPQDQVASHARDSMGKSTPRPGTRIHSIQRIRFLVWHLGRW